MKVYLVINIKRKYDMFINTGETSKTVLWQGGTQKS
jgi:hypothetical protein